MAEDEKVVQEERTSQEIEETASTEETTETKETVETKEGLTEEKVQQMIADETVKAVQEAKEAGRRELQSAQDRNRAELARAERRAQQAEYSTSAARSRLLATDPDAAKDMELTDLRMRDQDRTAFDQEDAWRQQQGAYARALQDSLGAHLEALGIAPNDERIDWAMDVTDYIQGRSRFDGSIAKIIKEEQQTMQSGLEARLKKVEGTVEKVNVEANSVETTTSQGVVAGSDEEFIKLFADYKLPYTKANVERYNKIQNS